jgi:hypothetical protein
LLGLIVRSLTLKGKVPGGHVERLRSVRLNAELSCDIPLSWSARPIAGPDTLRGAVDLVSSADSDWLGQIRLRWIANDVDTTQAREVAKMEQELAQAGITLGTRVATNLERIVAGGFTVTAQAVNLATLHDNSVDLECWRNVLRDSRFTVYCLMLTPARTSQFYWWAVNRYALDTVATSLR